MKSTIFKVRYALLVALACAAANATNAQAGDLKNGQRIYGTYCAGCHGPQGIAVMPQAPSFARGDRLMQPDPMLANTVKAGRGPMPAFLGMLNEREILDVLGYIRTLR